jgi:hypothetical protein
MTNQAEGNYLRDILRWEQDEAGRLSREVVVVLSGQNLAMGAVVGKVTKSTPATGTAGTNTGGGTCTAVTAGAKARIGTYTLTALSATAFAVKDPDGVALPDAVVGTPYVNDGLNFTINDGSPDFIAGDTFTIAVAAGTGKVRAINFSAVDGTQDAYGFLIAACDASLADTAAVAIVRDAVIVSDNLVWPVTSPVVTDAQKAAALAQLADKSIVARVEA